MGMLATMNHPNDIKVNIRDVFETKIYALWSFNYYDSFSYYEIKQNGF